MVLSVETVLFCYKYKQQFDWIKFSSCNCKYSETALVTDAQIADLHIMLCMYVRM